MTWWITWRLPGLVIAARSQASCGMTKSESMKR